MGQREGTYSACVFRPVMFNGGDMKHPFNGKDAYTVYVKTVNLRKFQFL